MSNSIMVHAEEIEPKILYWQAKSGSRYGVLELNTGRDVVHFFLPSIEAMQKLVKAIAKATPSTYYLCGCGCDKRFESQVEFDIHTGKLPSEDTYEREEEEA